MSIHSEIKRLRKAKRWSQRQLAEAISQAEGLAQPLNWQTVQQWEREPDPTKPAKATAPKRTRLETVARVLGTTVEALMAGTSQPPTTVADLSGSEGLLLGLFRTLQPDEQARLINEVRERAAPYNVQPEKRSAAA